MGGDTLLVYDGQLSRVSLFATEGAQLLKIINLAPTRAGLPTWVSPLRGGGFLAGYTHPFQAGNPKPSDRDRWITLAVLSPSGVVSNDSVLVLPGSEALVARNAEAVVAGFNPFGPEALPLRNSLRAQAPKYWPPVRDVVLDDRGNIWLGTTQTPQAEVRWDIFDKSGKRQFQTTMPWDLSPRAFIGDKVYAVATDEDDVPTVIVMRYSISP